MFRKSIQAIAAAAALTMVALAPTGASAAYWGGYGWYGKPSHYSPYRYGGFYGPRYFYGGWKFGGRKKFYRYY
jgi:hypothetical protein